jgi:hypothetical protein
VRVSRRENKGEGLRLPLQNSFNKSTSREEGEAPIRGVPSVRGVVYSADEVAPCPADLMTRYGTGW